MENFAGRAEIALDVAILTLEQLQEHLNQLEEYLAVLDEKNPANMSCEKYDVWVNEHKDVEDHIDEVIGRIEELRG